MAQYLTLSRAARLVGVKRGALQSRISDGELPTFEGMIELNDLLRVYPDTRVDDATMIEKVDSIKRKAVPRSLRAPSGMPDTETVVARLTQLSEELAQAESAANRYASIIEQLRTRLIQLQQAPHTSSGIAELSQWLEHAMATQQNTDLKPHPLTVRDTVLRLMAAHVHLFPSRHDFFVEGNDSILDAGLRAGYGLPYGCSDASCGRCRARLLAGTVKRLRAPVYGLSEAERRRGLLLTCCNTAISDVELEVDEIAAHADIEQQHISAKICNLQRPSDDVVLIDVKSPASQQLQFLAGQYAALSINGVDGGEYSIASCPCDASKLQFHIGRAANTTFVKHIFHRTTASDELHIHGPRGSLKLDHESCNSLVFLAWDTGFAPLKGLIEHAVALDTAERMHLYWISSTAGGHYYHNLCRSWADALDNVDYTPITLANADSSLQQVLLRVMNEHPDLAAHDFYLSAPAAVLAHAEPFLLARGLPRVQLHCEVLRQGHGVAET